MPSYTQGEASPMDGTSRRDSESPDTDLGDDIFESPLPGGDETWRKSPLGPPSEWPKSLQANAVTLASFAYPAAVFWGDELVLLHNEAWTKAGGVDEQGQVQRGRLKADAWNAMYAALRGGNPQRIASGALLRGDSKEAREQYTVLISPLFDASKPKQDDFAAGLLAQLLPKPEITSGRRAQPSNKDKGAHPDGCETREKHDLDLEQLGDAADNVPLDEHPFFHRFAEMLPNGLAILDHKAHAIFVNQHFYQLTTHQGGDQSFKSWPQSIHPDDYDRVMNLYHEAFVSQKQVRTEFRAQGMQNPWRLLLLTPLGDENLQHISLREYGGFICSVVDISSEKSAEIAQRKAANEARERKEQQERFIDMISHEIRNPLSAVMHCSEDIEEAVSNRDNIDVPAIMEAVDTINLCISHQRNIVDDVLSFSKLDASMLALVPKTCQPSRQLANSLKMFHPEFRKQSLDYGYKIDTSYAELDIEWVKADLSRIGQVLINLVSNAIKFTARSDGEKQIIVSVGASHERPTSYPPNVVFFSSEPTAYRMDATNTPDWGTGEAIYVLVAVKDTGIGISDEGQKRLFERFRQATPKTGEIYGGSGLGLNISRKLCHLHGGEIGVSAIEGSGSTFSFFFKVRRSDPPQDYPGRREEDIVDLDTMRQQIKELGNSEPNDTVDESTLPESLKSPPVERVEESTPHPDGTERDERYLKTADVAEQVPEPDGDRYAAAETPDSVVKREESAKTKAENALNGEPKSGATHERKNSIQHVLLVEDNVINQRIVLRKLKAKGFQVTTANNGQEAVDVVRNAPKPSSGDDGALDVILMDQEMPVMDGNAATKAIRTLEDQGEVERVPILGVTANVRGEQQDEMLGSGMDDVISKPYRIDEMVAKIRKMTISED